MFRDNNIGVLILNQNGPGLQYSNLTRNAAAFFLWMQDDRSISRSVMAYLIIHTTWVPSLSY